MKGLRAVLFALPLVLVGCGGGDTTASGSSAAATDTGVVGEDPYGGGSGGGGDTGAAGEVAGTITISGFAYGDPLTVAPGALIRVVNEDSAEHSVTAKDGTSFDTGLLGQGEEVTFNAPTEGGTYEITCSNHPQMSGQLIVAG